MTVITNLQKYTCGARNETPIEVALRPVRRGIAKIPPLAELRQNLSECTPQREIFRLLQLSNRECCFPFSLSFYSLTMLRSLISRPALRSTTKPWYGSSAQIFNPPRFYLISRSSRGYATEAGALCVTRYLQHASC